MAGEIEFTRHNRAAADLDNGQEFIDCLGKSQSDVVKVDSGSVSAALSQGIYRIRATANCRILVAPTATSANATSKGELWLAGEKEIRYVKEGEKIAVGPTA